MTTNGSIDRRDHLSYPEFAREYLFANRPVVITDALKDWAAIGKWTPEFFKQKYGNLKWDLNGGSYDTAALADMIVRSTREKPAPYLHSIQFEDYFGEIMADISPTPSYLFPNWLESGLVPTGTVGHAFYFGGTGGSFPVLHYDTQHTHAFLCQIYGEKEYICYSPDETDKMYPDPKKRNLSQVDVWKPDPQRFPRFVEAKEIRFKLLPGELLFVPAGWWHTVQMLTPSITVSKCIVNASNWRDYVLDVCYRSGRVSKPMSVPVHAAMAGVGLLLRARDLVRGPR